MPTYRALCWDGDRIVDGFDFEADDDREALALLALRKRSDCELWQVGRLVCKVPKGANPLWVEREP